MTLAGSMACHTARPQEERPRQGKNICVSGRCWRNMGSVGASFGLGASWETRDVLSVCLPSFVAPLKTQQLQQSLANALPHHHTSTIQNGYQEEGLLVRCGAAGFPVTSLLVH